MRQPEISSRVPRAQLAEAYAAMRICWMNFRERPFLLAQQIIEILFQQLVIDPAAGKRFHLAMGRHEHRRSLIHVALIAERAVFLDRSVDFGEVLRFVRLKFLELRGSERRGNDFFYIYL